MGHTLDSGNDVSYRNFCFRFFNHFFLLFVFQFLIPFTKSVGVKKLFLSGITSGRGYLRKNPRDLFGLVARHRENEFDGAPVPWYHFVRAVDWRDGDCARWLSWIWLRLSPWVQRRRTFLFRSF